jgi:hypothetical protein
MSNSVAVRRSTLAMWPWRPAFEVVALCALPCDKLLELAA